MTREKSVIDTLKLHENDTGSSSVQVALLTEHIGLLTEHLKKNKKDFSCRRSLLKKVATRKRFLRYIKSKNEELYKNVISTLGLKK